MLGISLDSNTHIEEASKCRCTVHRHCTIQHCECYVYCYQHQNTYDRIKKAGFTKNAFLTFNPKPKLLKYGTDYDEFKDYFKDFFKKDKNIIDYIICAELTTKGQLHYHCYFSFVSKVTVIKTMVQPMYFMGNVLILYGTEPKMGIHYLFKTASLMTDYFEGYEPFLTTTPVTTPHKKEGRAQMPDPLFLASQEEE